MVGEYVDCWFFKDSSRSVGLMCEDDVARGRSPVNHELVVLR